MSNGSVIINPYGIVHPVTFDPAGGMLPTVKICVDDTPESALARSTAWAVEKWNSLVPKLHNCASCISWSDSSPATGTLNFASTVLHELGHCAMGLNHVYLGIDANGDGAREHTDFTISYGGAVIGLDDGMDDVRGSKDDLQLAVGGSIAEVVNWFVISTNDPIHESPFVIDSLSYSRSFSNFPASSSTYSASANSRVASLLGSKNTQSVMGRTARNLGRFDLAPDDIHTISMARTGIDRLSGTSDDYDVQLEVVPCSDPHHITVDAGPLMPGFAGVCTVHIDFASPNPPSPATADSYKLVTGATITMSTTPAIPFDFGIPLFYGSFEPGDFSGWVLEP